MAITQHPTLPFIEVGTTLDFARRCGYHDHPDFFGTEDEWEFRIDGSSGGVICQTAEDAQSEAEAHFFKFDMDYAEQKLAGAITAGDVPLALAIAERKGYWQGKNAEREQMRQLLLPALEHLETATRK